MALVPAALEALALVLTPAGLFFVVAGTLLGLLFGVVPGLGALVALALLLPFTFDIQPEFAFFLMAAALGGSNFGGSITSILINTPGTATNVATLIDGYPMARDGRADEAIGAAAASSALGALLGIVVLIAFLPIMTEFMLLFGPPEVFWLGLLAIVVVATVTGDSLILGLISGGIGLFLSFHGFNAVTGSARFTFGTTYLYDGIHLVPAMVGIFAFAEMIRLSGEEQVVDELRHRIGENKWKGARSVITHKWLFVRSAVLGVVIGIVPGIGGTSANYLAYYQAVATSNDSESFGQGDIRGVIATEAANDAKDGGSLIPTLGLGIPGSASMAIFIGAFLFHGMTPGPLLFQDNLVVVIMIIFALIISNLLTSAIGVVTAGHLARLTQVRTSILVPVVASMAVVGAFLVRSQPIDMGVTVVFGVVGILMIKIGMTRVPLVLGLILGGIVEKNLQRTFQLGGGSPEALVDSPLSVVLVALIVLIVTLPILRWAMWRVFGVTSRD